MKLNDTCGHNRALCVTMATGVNSQWPVISWESLAWNRFASRSNLVTRLHNSCHALMMSFINEVHQRLGVRGSRLGGRGGAEAVGVEWDSWDNDRAVGFVDGSK